MKYQLIETTQFKKDRKKMLSRGFRESELKEIVDLLLSGNPLPAKFRDHPLVGDYEGFRECHINPNWLLLYYVLNERLVLVCARTGTHSDLF